MTNEHNDCSTSYQSKSHMRTERFGTVLSSPLFILAIALLLLNDHYLKSAYPGLLSGKLSDIAGLFAFPLFVASFFPRHKLGIYIFTGVAFIIWKLPAADTAIAAANSLLPFSIGRTIDYTDYWALLVLPLSYFYIPRRIIWENKVIRIGTTVLACYAFCATAGTHGKIKSYDYRTSTYQLQSYIDSVFADYPELNIPKNDTLYEEIGSSYFRIYFVDAKGPEVFVIHYYGGKEYWDKNSNHARISIISAGPYQQRLKIDDDLSSEERERIIKKFETGFIAKLNKYIAPSPSEEDE